MMRRLLVISCLSACALAGNPSDSVIEATTGAASVSLTSSNATINQTSDTSWSLSKTGSVNTSSKTVTWTITATKGSTVGGQLIVSGFMGVTNNGGQTATIGNIVVNLQKKSGSSWKSVSVDVADATSDDAATTASIDPKASSENISTFTENSASGELKFTDASSNSVFSLVPEKVVAPGATVNLLFSAVFDNNVLHLANNTAVRAEVIVTFGNSTSHAPSAQNVDINGNGTIDADEGWVRSVPTRLGLTVPAAQGDNASVTISDSASNITTTGDVTFSNAQFNLGATSGTVTVTYSGGANGGKITNCATATGSGTTQQVSGYNFPIVGGVNLTACDTEDVGADTCTEGAAGCGWKNGDLTTYDQSAWGDSSTAAASNLNSNYTNVYAGTLGILEVGVAGSAGFSMQFETAAAVISYLPAIGSAAALDADLLDPTTSNSGQFGGDVVALRLNVDFSDAGDLAAAIPTRFGDLTLCGFTSQPALNGTTVRQFLAMASTLLGGGSATYSIADIDPITISLNNAFGGGTASSFAQAHLAVGACK